MKNSIVLDWIGLIIKTILSSILFSAMLIFVLTIVLHLFKIEILGKPYFWQIYVFLFLITTSILAIIFTEELNMRGAYPKKVYLVSIIIGLFVFLSIMQLREFYLFRQIEMGNYYSSSEGILWNYFIDNDNVSAYNNEFFIKFHKSKIDYISPEPSE